MRPRRPLSGVGIDVVDLRRASNFFCQHASRLDRFFLPHERLIVRRSSCKVKAFALIFACKEAASKALGDRVVAPGQLRDYSVRMIGGRFRVFARGASFEMSVFDLPGSVGVLALARGGAVR